LRSNVIDRTPEEMWWAYTLRPGSDIADNTIDIRWPSGILQHLDTVKADQFLKVYESLRFAGAPAVNKIR
jgi:hypothetical protein